MRGPKGLYPRDDSRDAAGPRNPGAKVDFFSVFKYFRASFYLSLKVRSS
jgi:hypothetical protein